MHAASETSSASTTWKPLKDDQEATLAQHNRPFQGQSKENTSTQVEDSPGMMDSPLGQFLGQILQKRAFLTMICKERT